MAGEPFQQGLRSGAIKAEWPASPGQGGARLDLNAPFDEAPKPERAVKVMADARVRLSESLAKTHGLDSEAAVRAACDPYLAELEKRLGEPGYEALYEDALEAKAAALGRLREREAEREMRAIEVELNALKQAEAQGRMADQVAPLKVPLPSGLGALPAPQLVSDHLDPIVKVGSFLLDLAPFVGSTKLATEAVTGRDVMGNGAKLSEDERLLRVALVTVPVVGSLMLRGAVRAAPAVVAIATRAGRSAEEVLAALRTLRALGPDAKALEGVLAKLAAGEALTREETVLLRRAATKIGELRAGGPLRQAEKRAAQMDSARAKAAARGGEVAPTTGPGGATSDVPHVRQSHDVSCGPACGEMASGHHARTSPGSVATSEATLMRQPEFNAKLGGMGDEGLAAALQREAPVPGRSWKAMDPLPGGPRTHQSVRAGLETALREGDGVAIVYTYKPGPKGVYPHWVVVRELKGGKVLVHDPEIKKHLVAAITAEGFGEYVWMGDTVLAAAKRP